MTRGRRPPELVEAELRRAIPPDAFERAARAWLESLALLRRVSPRTTAAYRYDLKDYLGFLRAKNLAGPEAVTSGHVSDYLLALRRAGAAAATLARRRSAIHGFHAHCQRAGLASDDPAARMPSLKLGRRLPRALSHEEVERLLAQPVGTTALQVRDRALLELAYASGLRVSELVGLARGRVDFETRTVTVPGKGNRERTTR